MVSTSHISTSEADGQRLNSNAVIGLGAIALGIAGFAFWLSQAASASRIAFEQQLREEIAAESRSFCEKWGQPAGTRQHAACIVDLSTIRAKHEKRMMADADQV